MSVRLSPAASAYPNHVSEPAEDVTVERLTLVSRVSWLELEEPVFLQPGDRYWADFDTRVVVVESADGATRRFRRSRQDPDQSGSCVRSSAPGAVDLADVR